MVKTARIEQPQGMKNPLPDLSSAPSNGPSKEETLFAVGQLKSMAAEKAALAKKHKGIRSALKLHGHILKDIEHNIIIEGQLDDTELETLKNRKRIAEFMGLTIGSQVSFNDILSGDTPSQNDLEEQAYQRGYERGVGGIDCDTQAYPPITQLGAKHRSGWDDGQKFWHEKLLKLNETIANVEANKAAKKGKSDADDEADEETQTLN